MCRTDGARYRISGGFRSGCSAYSGSNTSMMMPASIVPTARPYVPNSAGGSCARIFVTDRSSLSVVSSMRALISRATSGFMSSSYRASLSSPAATPVGVRAKFHLALEKVQSSPVAIDAALPPLIVQHSSRYPLSPRRRSWTRGREFARPSAHCTQEIEPESGWWALRPPYVHGASQEDSSHE